MKWPRMRAGRGSALVTVAVLAAVGLVASLATYFPATTRTTQVASASGPAANPAAAAGDATTPGSPNAIAPGPGTGVGQVTQRGGAAVANTKAGLTCAAGRNGGSTDVGVSATTIKLAATVVDDGPGSSFLGPVRIGMQAVVNKVNQAGGVCGRRLDLQLRNDSWDAQTGSQFIQNFVEDQKVFALAVVPSSEGLRAADSYIAAKGVPVVGTDGMLIHQYRNPWIWPVATSTISTMHIMAKDAAARGAKEFGIVFDAKYHFGVEGAYAFDQAVKRLTGNDIQGFDPSLKNCRQRFCGIQPGQPSYGSEVSSFNSACGMSSTGSATGSRCDFVAVLLEPDTAVTWFAAGRGGDPAMAGKIGNGFAGAQPLFNRGFAERCGGQCDGMRVWTGYEPPIEQFASAPAVARYADEVRQVSSSVDAVNQFVEGGYIGMTLLVQALNRTGPNLTRAALKATLDSMTFDSGMASPLTWRPGNHQANTSAMAFEIQYRQSFSGWRQQTGFETDPWAGQDIPKGE